MRRVLLGFWSLYFGLVVLTNLLDSLCGLGLLPAGWRFRSGNLSLLADTLGDPDWAGILLAGATLWQAWAAWLFWRAMRADGSPDTGPVRRAFTVAVGLWAAFVLADELFLRYDLEGVHLRLLMAQVVTFLAVYRSSADDV